MFQSEDMRVEPYIPPDWINLIMLLKRSILRISNRNPATPFTEWPEEVIRDEYETSFSYFQIAFTVPLLECIAESNEVITKMSTPVLQNILNVGECALFSPIPAIYDAQKAPETKFTMPSLFWKYFYRGEGKRTLHSYILINNQKVYWTDVFNSYFEAKNYTCVLAFKWHKCNLPGKSSVQFRCQAQCKHTDCATFIFSTVDKIDGSVYVSLKITQLGVINHGEVRCRRFYKGSIRADLRKQLLYKSSSPLKYEQMAKGDLQVLKDGNLNAVPDATILWRMSSENIKADDLDSDQYKHLQKLQRKFQEEWPGTHFKGYIQALQLSPFWVHLYTQYQIQFLIDKKKKHKQICCYLDATGSIISQPPGAVKRVYYYALIFPGGDNSPVPVAEFISERHTITAISHFLAEFVYHAKKMHTSRLPLISKIETDFNMALIQSVIVSFNSTNMIDYLIKMWEYVLHPNDTAIEQFVLVFLVCPVLFNFCIFIEVKRITLRLVMAVKYHFETCYFYQMIVKT